MEIKSIALIKKSGGRSGAFSRGTQPTIVAVNLKEGTEVSLLDSKVQAEMKNLDGLCMKKFRADVITNGMDYGNLQVDDDFNVGGYAFTVTRRKGCYDECPRYQAQEHCPLKNGCTFAAVGKQGDAG